MNQAPHDRPDAAIPRMALGLGVAGLLPFVAGAVLPWVGLGMWAGQVVAVYAACILSFMGGVQWGALLPRLDRDGAAAGVTLAVSVMPALVGWLALLMSADPLLTVGMLFIGFVGVWGVDRFMGARGWVPPWYLRLRDGLTAVVLLCLFALLLRLYTLQGGA